MRKEIDFTSNGPLCAVWHINPYGDCKRNAVRNVNGWRVCSTKCYKLAIKLSKTRGYMSNPAKPTKWFNV